MPFASPKESSHLQASLALLFDKIQRLVLVLANQRLRSKAYCLSLLLVCSLTPLAFNPSQAQPVDSQLPQLNMQQRQWLGQQIFNNECSAKLSCLTSWNAAEDFPSLGIGHFIWFQAQQQEVFTESFPKLLSYYQQREITLPQWINELENQDSPWPNREAFLADFESIRMHALREFLADTMAIQVDFIIQRLYQSLPKLLAATPQLQHTQIKQQFYHMANSVQPYGIYALIDYVNFKGEGVAINERYAMQGWGLLQVLQQMPYVEGELNHRPLQNFVEAGGTVLSTRVANAPTGRDEQRWLRGWHNRLQSYLPPQ